MRLHEWFPLEVILVGEVPTPNPKRQEGDNPLEGMHHLFQKQDLSGDW